jgi:hypothetical protein
MDKSCQFLVSRLLLLSKDKVKVLEARKLAKNRRRFYRFFLMNKYPKEYGMNDVTQVVKSPAVSIAEKRISLGESVKVRAENLGNDGCWQFCCGVMQQNKIH